MKYSKNRWSACRDSPCLKLGKFEHQMNNDNDGFYTLTEKRIHESIAINILLNWDKVLFAEWCQLLNVEGISLNRKLLLFIHYRWNGVKLSERLLGNRILTQTQKFYSTDHLFVTKGKKYLYKGEIR